MLTKLKKIFLAVAALVALAVGGAAFAQAGGDPAKKQDQPAAETETGKGDASEKGEREGKEAESSATDRDNIQDENGKDDATEKGEFEGSEVPGDDGPGGHADEPGDPNADHQFEGKE